VYARPKVFIQREDVSGKAARTSSMVRQTFLHMLAGMPYQAITIADLAGRCGLARSTVYRKFASIDEILWDVSYAPLKGALGAALAGDRACFREQMRPLVETPGLMRALAHLDAHPVRGKFATLAEAEVERRTGRRRPKTCGAMLSAAWFACMEEHSKGGHADLTGFDDLVLLTYVTAFMTDQGLAGLVRDQAKQEQGRFPPAVSVAESLADPEFILSMIDGRPYRSLTRHIARYGMSPDDYRRCFSLSSDYPMVAPGYSERRRQLARAIGLGKAASEREVSLAA
jgi:predicted transcriptional regulator